MPGKNDSQIAIRQLWTIFVWGLLVCLLLGGCGAPKPKVYRVGILAGLDFFADTTDGFKSQMTTLGYTEGENIAYDVQEVNFDPAAYKSALQNFVDDKVDLIFVFPTEAAQEAKAVTQGTDIPVVFAHAGVEDTDLVNSMREPGGNITGVRFPAPDLVAKRYEILLEMVPKVKRICVPYQNGYPLIKSEMEALYAIKAAEITVVEAPANTPVELEAFFTAREGLDDVGFDAILTVPEPLVGVADGFTIVAKFAYEHKLPLGGSPMAVGDYATIFGLTPDNVAVGEQAASMADKILKGISAGTIPVVSPEGFLQINLKAAEQLGVTVPEGLLNEADQVIR